MLGSFQFICDPSWFPSSRKGPAERPSASLEQQLTCQYSSVLVCHRKYLDCICIPLIPKQLATDEILCARRDQSSLRPILRHPRKAWNLGKSMRGLAPWNPPSRASSQFRRMGYGGVRPFSGAAAFDVPGARISRSVSEKSNRDSQPQVWSPPLGAGFRRGTA